MKMTQAMKEKTIELRLQGQPAARIASEIGVNIKTIQKVIRDAGMGRMKEKCSDRMTKAWRDDFAKRWAALRRAAGKENSHDRA